jgi:hypothetical protein
MAGLLLLGGCAFISNDETVEDLKANAEQHYTVRTTLSPTAACPKLARMLAWCANGPNFHYRCNIAPDGSRAELTGTLEAVYRTEFLMVAELTKSTPDSAITIHQHSHVLIYDYGPMIEKYLTAPDCHPG